MSRCMRCGLHATAHLNVRQQIGATTEMYAQRWSTTSGITLCTQRVMSCSWPSSFARKGFSSLRRTSGFIAYRVLGTSQWMPACSNIIRN